MRVYNITDSGKQALIFRGLANQPIRVAGMTVKPGCSVDVPDKAAIRSEIQQHVMAGALSIDGVPKDYTPAAVVPTEDED